MGRKKSRIRTSIDFYKRDISSEDCQGKNLQKSYPLTFQLLWAGSSPFSDDEDPPFDQNGQTLHD